MRFLAALGMTWGAAMTGGATTVMTTRERHDDQGNRIDTRTSHPLCPSLAAQRGEGVKHFFAGYLVGW